MVLKTLVHFEVPHPFYPQKRVIITPVNQAKNILQRIFVLFSKKREPFLTHKVYSFAPDAETSTKINTHCHNLFLYWRQEYRHSIGKDLMEITLFILFAYAIWNIGIIPLFVDYIFTSVGDYLNNYARVVLILSPLLYIGYRKFLIGDTIQGKRKAFAFLKVEEYLHSSVRERFIEDLRFFLSREKNPDIRASISTLITALQEKNDLRISSFLQDIQSMLDTKRLSWKEEETLRDLLQELTYLHRNHFQREIIEIHPHPLLQEFFSSPFYQEWSNTMHESFQTFLVQPQKTRAMDVAEQFHRLEQELRRTLHNRLEPQHLDTLTHFYHRIYLRMARLAQAKRICLLPETIDDFLVLGRPRPFLSPLRTFLLTTIMIGSTLFLFSLHLVNQDDFLVVRKFVPGWQGIWGERVEVIHQPVLTLGSKKLLVAPPRPFSFAHRATSRPQTARVIFILKEVQPSFQGGIIGTLKYLWEKGMAFFKEGYGNDFIILEGTVSFQVEDPEKWKQYDFDGMGKERLERDLETSFTSYFEDLQGEYRENFLGEEYEQAKAHLTEVSKSANFKTWVRRFLYPSPLDTYRVGSVYDMYLVGLDWLLRHPRLEKNPEWQEFVQHEIETIKEKMKKEHDELIANPLKVRKMFQNPNLFEFAEYPGLYQTLLFMAMTELINARITEDLQKEEMIKRMNLDTLNYLCEKRATFLSAIGIRLQSVNLRLGRVSYLHYLRLLQRRQNLL